MGSLAEKNKYRIRNMSKNKNQNSSCSSLRAQRLYQSEVAKFKNNFQKLATDSIYSENEEYMGKLSKFNNSKSLRQNLLDSQMTQKNTSRFVNDQIHKRDKRPNVNYHKKLTKEEVDSSNY